MGTSAQVQARRQGRQKAINNTVENTKPKVEVPSAPTKGNKPLAKDVPAHRVIKLAIRAATGKKGIRKYYFFSEDVRIIKLSASTPQRLKFLRRWVVRVTSAQR
jgi:hypothetical protein